MRNASGRLRHIIQPAPMLLELMVDTVCDLGLCLRPNPTLAPEVLRITGNRSPMPCRADRIF